MINHPNHYTKEMVSKIEAMADKGYTDSEIAETLNLNVAGISGRTRRYWDNKFNQKKKQ